MAQPYSGSRSTSMSTSDLDNPNSDGDGVMMSTDISHHEMEGDEEGDEEMDPPQLCRRSSSGSDPMCK